jgi:hypothetical protein
VKKIAAALFLLISMAVIALPASADPTYTLTLLSAGGPTGANTDNIYIYPYTFSVQQDGSLAAPTTVNMMCFDFDREIYVGEKWDTTVVNITANPLPSGPSDTPAADAQQLKALALIYADLLNPPANGYTASEYQFAAWSILNGSTVTNGSFSGYDANAKLIAKNAMQDALTDTTFPYADYDYYDPIFGSQIPVGDGSPQRFMFEIGGTTPPPVGNLTPAPEPSSLMLLGTGVLSLAGAARRRFKA